MRLGCYAQALIFRDFTAHVELIERVVQGRHSVFLARLHRRFDLVHFVVADQRADGGGADHDLSRHDAAAALGALQQRLRQHAFQHDASCARTWDCWCAGKTSMMRLMDSAAELVCSVAKARWPVSAMVSAAWIVSRSRISPISTTSGSCRRAYFSAAWKLFVSVPTSRWLTMHAWWRWMNSIGSSTVMMWPFSSLLILSIIAASVVLLPEPVGPVTRTRPRGRSASCATTLGKPSSWNVFTLNGICRITTDTQPRCWKTLPRMRARF